MTNVETPTPLACVPIAIPPAERAAHFERARRLVHELAEERRDLADGFAFRFRADAFETVVLFVANERKCCPFVDFELTAGANAGPVWLRLTGPEGAREALSAELGRTPSSSCC